MGRRWQPRQYCPQDQHLDQPEDLPHRLDGEDLPADGVPHHQDTETEGKFI